MHRFQRRDRASRCREGVASVEHEHVRFIELHQLEDVTRPPRTLDAVTTPGEQEAGNGEETTIASRDENSNLLQGSQSLHWLQARGDNGDGEGNASLRPLATPGWTEGPGLSASRVRPFFDPYATRERGG